MDSKSLTRLIGISEGEKRLIESFIEEFGLDVLVNHVEAADISNKAKKAILQIDQVLHNRSQALESLAELTEIPLKLLQSEYGSKGIKALLEHPESLDIDSRQLYKFRCIKDVYCSYQNECREERICEETENDLER